MLVASVFVFPPNVVRFQILVFWYFIRSRNASECAHEEPGQSGEDVKGAAVSEPTIDQGNRESVSAIEQFQEKLGGPEPENY